MDTELKCNRLTCRRSINDKAVVTTCSHIFCVECANELFNPSRLCPACDTALTEPDDIVVCSLHPSNDYKTSVLSGLAPSIIMEICSRAIAFWVYQIHQENCFQHAVVRNLSEKNSQIQKQLDNVVREANSEINLLQEKCTELERDLETERRKVRELQDSGRERDKEYQKLKTQFDRIKQKALLSGQPLGSGPNNSANLPPLIDHGIQQRKNPNSNPVPGNVDLSAVVGGMEANKIQRTPIGNRTASGPPSWMQRPRNVQANRGSFAPTIASTYHSRAPSEGSNSATEVENMLGYRPAATGQRNGWSNTHSRPGFGHGELGAPYAHPPQSSGSGKGSGGRKFRPAMQPRR